MHTNRSSPKKVDGNEKVILLMLVVTQVGVNRVELIGVSGLFDVGTSVYTTHKISIHDIPLLSPI